MTETNKITVYLHYMRGAGLIIPHPSGIIYSNVAGGTAIHYPEIEGIFIPYSVKDWMAKDDFVCPLTEDLTDYFTRVWGSSCRDGIKTEDADAIDAIFIKYELTKHIRINRDKLHPCKEAWLHITINSPAADWVELYRTELPFPNTNEAVLTWPNSD